MSVIDILIILIGIIIGAIGMAIIIQGGMENTNTAEVIVYEE